MVDALTLSKLLVLSTVSFVLAMAWTPLLTHFLYKYRLGKSIRSAVKAPMFAKLHAKKAGVPTMGGVLMWVTTAALALSVWLLASAFPASVFGHLQFLSRAQTWLPLAALIVAGLIGIADDVCNVFKIGPHGGGIGIRERLLLYTGVAAFSAWWFYAKLGWDFLHIPFYGDVFLGVWYVPFFMIVLIGTSFAVNETDGLDGLAGGTLASAFGAFAMIALIQGKTDLAALCGVIVGSLLAFLWFNIYPARFIMGDTGAMSLGVTLAIVAMLLNSALILPIIGVVFVGEALSAQIQILSKKIRGKKVFLIAPIHHHFEALGWPEPKVVMRFWVISWIGAGVGIIVALLDARMTFMG